MSDDFDFESRASPMPEKDPVPPKEGWSWRITQAEAVEYYRWVREHNGKHHGGKYPYCGAIGGQFMMTFTGTSLGDVAGVECNLCQAKGLDKLDYMHCLTDFSDW